MRRSRLESLLHDYVAGDLDEDRCRDIERRIRTDPRTRVLYEKVRAANDALKLLRERPEPPVRAREVLPRIQAAIAFHSFEARPHLPLEGMGTRFYRRVAVAATLLFAVTVGYVALVAPRAGAPPPTEPSSSRAASLVELGTRREGITAEEFFRLLEEWSGDPHELSVQPYVNVVPVGHGGR